MTIPSDDHLLAFGRIIHNFASVETGIKLTLAGILNTFLDAALISFQPYSALDLKNVAKSLSKERLRPELSDEFCHIVGAWAAYTGLRNVIAHSRWIEGIRSGSIKPRRLDIRADRARWIGNQLEEDDYTAPELEKIAFDLHRINERLKKFLHTSGVADVIDRNIDSESSDTSATSG